MLDVVQGGDARVETMSRLSRSMGAVDHRYHLAELRAVAHGGDHAQTVAPQQHVRGELHCAEV